MSEWELNQTGPNYTLRTIEHFRSELGSDAELCWLIGADSLGELHTWFEARTLVDACRIITVARPGYTPQPATELAQWFEMKQVERLLADVIIGPHIDIARAPTFAHAFRRVAVCVISFLMRFRRTSVRSNSTAHSGTI